MNCTRKIELRSQQLKLGLDIISQRIRDKVNLKIDKEASFNKETEKLSQQLNTLKRQLGFKKISSLVSTKLVLDSCRNAKKLKNNLATKQQELNLITLQMRSENIELTRQKSKVDLLDEKIKLLKIQQRLKSEAVSDSEVTETIGQLAQLKTPYSEILSQKVPANQSHLNQLSSSTFPITQPKYSQIKPAISEVTLEKFGMCSSLVCNFIASSGLRIKLNLKCQANGNIDVLLIANSLSQQRVIKNHEKSIRQVLKENGCEVMNIMIINSEQEKDYVY